MRQIGLLAQLVERVLSMQEVFSSIPESPSKDTIVLIPQLGQRQT